MADFYADPLVGGDGTHTTDDADPNTGLDDGGHIVRFVPALRQLVAICVWMKNYIDTKVAAITALAASAVNAPGTSATIATSIAWPTLGATVSSTLAQTGKQFVSGQSLVISKQSDRTQQFVLLLGNFTPGTGAFTGTVTYVATGSGSSSAWDVGLSPPVDITIAGRMTAAEAAIKKARYRRLLIDGKI